MLSKEERYYFDAEAIAEPVAASSIARVSQNGGHPVWNGNRERSSAQGAQTLDINKMVRRDGMRNKRSVWTVSIKPYKGAHFATFPPDLIQPCILAGCPKDGVVLDPFLGSGTTAYVAAKHGRRAVGIELNEEYLPLIRERMSLACPSDDLFSAFPAIPEMHQTAFSLDGEPPV